MAIAFHATLEARAAIDRIVAQHGPVMFHVTSGRCQSRCPLCLPANELRIGPRDNLIGIYEDVPVYEMESTASDGFCSNGSYLIDLEPGMTIGFSLEAAPGWRFVLRPVRGAARSADDFPAAAGER